MYIIYKDLESASSLKTPYNVIIQNIPNINWNLFNKLIENEKIDYDDLVIPTKTIVDKEDILILGTYLFDYRFGFDPDSKACVNCCYNDYDIKIINNVNEYKYYSGDKILYCPNPKYQIIHILKYYFENNLGTNYIFLDSVDFDCGRFHQDAIRKKYGFNWNGEQYVYDNINLFDNDISINNVSEIPKNNNSLYNISLNKVRQLFFSNQVDLKNVPYDILHDL
jgi:hypothetical protein